MPPIFLTRIVSALILGTALTVAAADPFADMVRSSDPVAPAEQRTKFKLPPGFDIQLVAAEPDINKPMNLAFDSAGRLWATTSIEYPWAAPTNRPGRDRLMIFEDFGPDGRARKITQFADGLNIPIGVYPFRSARSPGFSRKEAASNQERPLPPEGGTTNETWKAIVWSIPYIWLLEDTDGDGKADKRTPLYGPFDHTRDTHGNQASFRRGFDGWIYATHGFNNDSWITNRDGTVVHLNSGNTYRLRLDGSKLEHHTHGQVNPFGLAFDPRGNLYSSDCHSAPLYQLLAGGHYPSFGKPHDGLGFAPVMLEHAHGSTAIDGAVYYADDLWPAEYHDTLFIGNVMTSRLNRDKITFVGSTPKAIEQPDFLTTTDPWFRPVDNTFGPDGALYVADFYNRIIGHYEVPLTHPGRDRERGRIWRVVYTNAVAADVRRQTNSDQRSDVRLVTSAATALRPSALPGDLKSLVEELGSPSLTRRLLAQHELEDRFSAAAIPELRLAARGVYDFAKREAKTHAQIHALWALFNLASLDNESLGAGLTPADPLLKVHTMRLLAELGHRRKAGLPGAPSLFDAGNLRGALLVHLGDTDALVKRCAAEALAAWPDAGNLPPLVGALEKTDREDTHLVYVLRKAIRDTLLSSGAFDSLTRFPVTQRGLVDDILPAIPSADAARYILTELSRLGTNSSKVGPLLQHAARHGDASSAGTIATFARDKFATDPAMQLSLLKSVQVGLGQRGATTPDTVTEWGRSLSSQFVDTLAGSSGDWQALALDGAGTPVPWVLQERKSVDGQSARVISSLAPGGEALTGILRSRKFSLPAKLAFFLCGHDGQPDQPGKGVNKVVLKSADGRVLREVSPPRNDVARKVEWNFSTSEQGKPAQLEIIDGDTGAAYAWLALGRIEPAVVSLPAIAPREMQDRALDAVQLVSSFPSPATLAKLRPLDDGRFGGKTQAALLRTLLAHDPNYARSLAARLQPGAAGVEEIATALAEADQPQARSAVVAFLGSAPTRLQKQIATTLSGSRSGAEALLGGISAGKITAQVLSDTKLIERLRASKPDNIDARLASLTKDLPPADGARQTLIDARRAALGSTPVDLARGQQLYQLNCAACHRIDGLGGLVAPQLDGVGSRGPERLCEDILDPNRNVDHAFQPTILTLKDDEVVSGLFRREEGAMLVLADATGAEIKVPKAQVKERAESKTSLMPDNFGEILKPDDFNDLVGWLLSKRGQK